MSGDLYSIDDYNVNEKGGYGDGDEDGGRDNYDYDMDAYEYEEKTNYVPGQDAYSRTRRGNLNILSGDLPFNKNLLRELNADVKVQNTIEIILISLLESNKLTNQDAENIREKIKNTNKSEYKNPACFILGYFLTNGGKEQDPVKLKSRLSKTKLMMKDIDVNFTQGIESEDLIRYARLWLK